MTVKELLVECADQVAKGNGDKKIYVSADEEGNYFHELFYSFLNIDVKNEIEEWNKAASKAIEKGVVNKVTNEKEFIESLYQGINYEDVDNIIILG